MEIERKGLAGKKTKQRNTKTFWWVEDEEGNLVEKGRTPIPSEDMKKWNIVEDPFPKLKLYKFQAQRICKQGERPVQVRIERVEGEGAGLREIKTLEELRKRFPDFSVGYSIYSLEQGAEPSDKKDERVENAYYEWNQNLYKKYKELRGRETALKDFDEWLFDEVIRKGGNG